MRAQWSTQPYSLDSVLILYGTVTGTAETLAHKLAAELQCTGVTTRVRGYGAL
jgi:flavodoxin